jgi:hypothetical protein
MRLPDAARFPRSHARLYRQTDVDVKRGWDRNQLMSALSGLDTNSLEQTHKRRNATSARLQW